MAKKKEFTSGSYLEMIGAFQEAASIASTADHNETVGETNAAMFRLRAVEERKKGRHDASEFLKSAEEFKNRQKTAFAAQGVKLDSGTAAQTAIDTQLAGRLDAETIRNNANRRAYGYEVKAISDELSGRIAKIKGDTKAMQTVLGGLGRAEYFSSKSGKVTNKDAVQIKTGLGADISPFDSGSFA